MEYTDLEREYDELQKDYYKLQSYYDKLQKDYDDLDTELNVINGRVEHLVESKVATLLDKMRSFNNYYSEYSSVEECNDLLFCLSEDIEEYYINMVMTIEEIVETDALGLDILLTFYSYALPYNINIREWLSKIIIEEFVNNLRRNYGIIFITQLDYKQRKTLRDILINGNFVATYKFHFPIKQKHVSMLLLKLVCTDFSTESVYTHNKQYFNKEIIESLDIEQKLKENIMFQYKKDILKGDIK